MGCIIGHSVGVGTGWNVSVPFGNVDNCSHHISAVDT